MIKTKFQVIYLRRNVGESVSDMQGRVESVCEIHSSGNWDIVNVDFQTGALEVFIVMRSKQ